MKPESGRKRRLPLVHAFLSCTLFLAATAMTFLQHCKSGLIAHCCLGLAMVCLVLSFVAGVASISQMIQNPRPLDPEDESEIDMLAGEYVIPDFLDGIKKGHFSPESVSALMTDPSKTPSGFRFAWLAFKTRFKVGWAGLVSAVSCGIVISAGLCAACYLGFWVAQRGDSSTLASWALMFVQIVTLLVTACALCGFIYSIETCCHEGLQYKRVLAIASEKACGGSGDKSRSPSDDSPRGRLESPESFCCQDNVCYH
ncbi:hypothetical protein [Neorickettsia helminthoeca]|nr:hypothetical protein [Neorickettsia helminthoeca]